MKYRKTRLPKEFDQMKIVKSPDNPNFYVVNSEGVTMKSFVELKDARIWRDHFHFGYYSICEIIKIKS